MAVTLLFVYNGLTYLKFSNSISTIITIISAVIVYIIAIFAFRVLRKEEVSQLPFGNKIGKIIDKFEKN
ncbi:hypothetical protein D3C81_2252180 [compost metagenome]